MEPTAFRLGMQSINLSIQFLRSSEGHDINLATFTLFASLNRKRRDRWSEGNQSINVSHFNRKAWILLNNLIGRLQHYPISANSFGSVDRKSSLLVSQKVSDL